LHASVGLAGSLTYLAGPDDVLNLLGLDPGLRHKVDKHLAELYERASELIMRHRAAIEAVADRLRKRRYLSGEEIRRLYESSRSAEAPKPPL
jgi:cell division protease FtsH